MEKRQRKKLSEEEVALIKAMILTGKYKDQDILSYFSVPTRSVNQTRIHDIRRENTHKKIHPASKEQLEYFLRSWSKNQCVRNDDALVFKAREAMIGAVNTFNSAGLVFCAELFIVISIIA